MRDVMHTAKRSHVTWHYRTKNDTYPKLSHKYRCIMGFANILQHFRLNHLFLIIPDSTHYIYFLLENHKYFPGYNFKDFPITMDVFTLPPPPRMYGNLITSWVCKGWSVTFFGIDIRGRRESPIVTKCNKIEKTFASGLKMGTMNGSHLLH